MYFISSFIKQNSLFKACLQFRSQIETRDFDRHRDKYDILSFSDKKKLAKKWLRKYPEQAHFNYESVDNWIKEIVPMPRRIIEIGGWRGDLASRVFDSGREIEYWHNYDLLENGKVQRCNDHRYKLITLDDYLWNKPVSIDYNALIATHMIEHINWIELNALVNWLPTGIKTVLFEAPLPDDAEDYSWKGDHSSHVLGKGWLQVKRVMERKGFTVERTDGNTYIFLS